MKEVSSADLFKFTMSDEWFIDARSTDFTAQSGSHDLRSIPLSELLGYTGLDRQFEDLTFNSKADWQKLADLSGKSLVFGFSATERLGPCWVVSHRIAPNQAPTGNGGLYQMSPVTVTRKVLELFRRFQLAN